MPFLSPAKLLVVLVVALVVLGPDKLPQMAKQVGSLWGDFRRFREKLESEVRTNFPDLPSTDTIHQAVRSPLSFLDNLGESRESGNQPTAGTTDGAERPAVEGRETEPSPATNQPVGGVGEYAMSASIPGILATDPGVAVHRVRSGGQGLSDDPGMN
jgi:TatA/E family protein of Tat protein translocase